MTLKPVRLDSVSMSYIAMHDQLSIHACITYLLIHNHPFMDVVSVNVLCLSQNIVVFVLYRMQATSKIILVATAAETIHMFSEATLLSLYMKEAQFSANQSKKNYKDYFKNLACLLMC